MIFITTYIDLIELWAPKASQFFFSSLPKAAEAAAPSWAPLVPQFFFLSPPPKAPKGGAKGATPPEGEGNPAEGASSLLKMQKKFHQII